MTDRVQDALARIEQRQAAYEVVAHRILGVIEVHTEMLRAILEACTVEPGPSPTAEALQGILAAMREQAALLRELPDAISAAVRDELDRDDFTEEMGDGGGAA